MVTPRQYATAGALRAALETRLLERSRRDDVDLQRLRRQVAFDRLLARMFDPADAARHGWVLKGGYALELRFQQARTTKDLDLTVRVVAAGLGVEQTTATVTAVNTERAVRGGRVRSSHRLDVHEQAPKAAATFDLLDQTSYPHRSRTRSVICADVGGFSPKPSECKSS